MGISSLFSSNFLAFLSYFLHPYSATSLHIPCAVPPTPPPPPFYPISPPFFSLETTKNCSLVADQKASHAQHPTDSAGPAVVGHRPATNATCVYPLTDSTWLTAAGRCSTTCDVPHSCVRSNRRSATGSEARAGMHWKVGGGYPLCGEPPPPPPLQGAQRLLGHCLLTPSASLTMAFVTDSNRPQPLQQRPATAPTEMRTTRALQGPSRGGRGGYKSDTMSNPFSGGFGILEVQGVVCGRGDLFFSNGGLLGMWKDTTCVLLMAPIRLPHT